MPGNGEIKVKTDADKARSASEIRAEIDRARTQIATSAAALREELAFVSDWREWVRKRPWVFIGGAFAIGLFIGTRRFGRED
jgi:ElaB/YqjD/DUF883 family membrane-anchored ribosome-binding protein